MKSGNFFMSLASYVCICACMSVFVSKCLFTHAHIYGPMMLGTNKAEIVYYPKTI